MSRKLFLAPTTLPEAPAPAFLEAAARSGCDGVGLRVHPSPTLPYHPVAEAELKRAVRAAGLPVLDLYSFYLQPGADIDAMRPALALGAELGAKYALVQGTDPDRDRLRDAFGRFCDAAAGYGLFAMLEFTPARAVATLHQALRLVEDAGRANSGVLVDTQHFARAGHRIADLAAVPPARMPYVQIRVPVDAALLAALAPELPLSVEMPAPAGALPAEWARQVIDAARRLPATAPTASRPSA